MNQKLQNIIEIIRQSEKLDAEQKNTLLKAVKDTDKELEITAFKLERTEKVKKTTAILLEETIEELEQKRKAVEAQKNELEIEASLERVRTVAMSMHKSDDLLSICEISFKELRNLGFGELRNAIIHIFNDDDESFIDYDYSDYSGGEVTNFNYKSHKIVERYLEQIKSAKDAFAEIVIDEKQLADWKEFRKRIGDYDDSRLENINSLYYYFHSIGSGAIGISNFSMLTEEQVLILKRFRNVFDLAYRRYTDIKYAEAQTREAEIQLALERVRSRAMAMHKPEDLSDTVNVFFKELKSLGLVPIRCGVCEVHEETRSWTTAITNATQQGDSYEIFGDVKQLGLPILENLFNHWELQKEYYPVLKGADLIEYYHSFKPQLDVHDYHENTTHYGNYFYFKEGFVFAWTEVELSEEELDIFRRFTSVLSLSYRRYMDLKEAEYQAREAQIEAALEKVRVRTMTMQSSDELAETAYELYQQFGLLGEGPEQLTIGIIDETQMVMEFWLTLGGNQINRLFRAPIEEPIALNKSYIAWKEKKRSLVIDISGDELKAYYNFFKNLPDYKEYNEFRKSQSNEQRRVIHYAFFSKGFLALASEEPKSTETIELLERFAGVLQQTYTRFLDLQKAEAQAREAQIEAALERVRSRSMAMHHSDELVDASDVVFNQMKELGIESLRIGIGIINEEDKTVEIWSRSEFKGKVENKILGIVPFGVHPVFDNMVKAWKENKPFFSSERVGDEVREYYDNLAPYLSYPERVEFNDRETVTTFFFAKGSLNVISLEPLKEEECNIMIRFASVFGQMYRRFLDLKNAEAQAREAQIEAALERVRARTMGMQKSEELKEVIQLVYEQFVQLNIHIEHTGFIMDYKASDDMHIWLADQNGPLSEITIPYFDSPHWNSFKEAKENGLDFFANHLTFDEKNKFYRKLFTFIPDLPEEAREFYFNCPGLAISTVLLENVGLYIENFSGTPYTDEENNTLMRFGKVFQQTYTRFLDLQKAEAQAREALIEASLERVRSRSMAMHHSEELKEVVAQLFEGVDELGFDATVCNVSLINKENNTTDVWTAHRTKKGMSSYHVFVPSLKHSFYKELLSTFYKNKDFAVHELYGKEKKNYIRELFNKVDYSQSPDAVREVNKELVQSDERIVLSAATMKYGMLVASRSLPLTTEEAEILQRFAKVFEQTYTRFLDLQKAEAQNRIIQAENERKTQELEEARQLQLSMLPKELPKLPNLDIEVYMQTATEVGGDYYDFKVGLDGTLTTIIGDATGHGMKAGTVVTITKSLFNSMTANENILGAFDKISQVIKGMEFRQLSMCLLMMKIRGNRLSISSAAMPPALIYRAKNKTVEEIFLQGMPLGTMKNFTYRKIESHLNSGDIILLYSDGLPELANDEGQMFGYDKTKMEFLSVGEKEPEEIVDHLKNSASQWANGKEPDDDVTLVVIKVK